MSPTLSNVPAAEPFLSRRRASVPVEEEHHESGVWRLSEVAELFPAPAAPPERATRQEIYERFSPMVRRMARKTMRTLPRSIALDDIESAGWVGMSEAILRRPEGMPDEQFEAYASYRIRGAILDYLRSLDPLSRRLRAVARELHQVTKTLTLRLGRVPGQDELAAEMGISLAALQKNLADIQEAGVEQFDGSSGLDSPCARPSPEVLATTNQMLSAVAKYTKDLPERLQVVLTLHYQHERSLREIGKVLGVTESRVCQLHAEAVQRLRNSIDEQSKKGPIRFRPPQR